MAKLFLIVAATGDVRLTDQSSVTGFRAENERDISFVDIAIQSPSGRMVALGLLFFAMIWLPHLAWTSLAAPVDNIEQLTWVRSLEWGYYKHPPLPTWMLWLPAHLANFSEWSGYLLGATVTLGAMGVFWMLLRELRGSTYAVLALLAALCITYYNGRLHYYNHNVVLLLMNVASAWYCWRAFEDKRLRWWLALGVTMGLGALSKYQIAVTAISVLCFWVSQQGWREPRQVRGLLLAALVGLIIFTPHLLWLPAHDFGPVRYAMGTSLGADLSIGMRVFNAVNWLSDQIFNRSLPAFILLAVCVLSVLRRGSQEFGSTPPGVIGERTGSRALILCFAIVPLAFMAALGIVFGSELQLQWGTAFLPFIVPAVMEWKPVEFWRRVRVTVALKAFFTLQAILLVMSYVTSPLGFRPLVDPHWRTFRSEAFARQVASPARVALGGPVRVVTGDLAIVGGLALQLPERPLVLIDGRFDKSPWVPRDLVRDCGVLSVFRSSTAPPDAAPAGRDFPGIYWRVGKSQFASSCEP